MLTLTKPLTQIDEVADAIVDDFIFPAIVLMYADLGGGKTTLCQKICQRLNVTQNVTSPTFNLINHYQGNFHGELLIVHCDFYRVADNAVMTELYELNEPLCFLIEWPQKTNDDFSSLARRYNLPLTHVNIIPDDFDSAELNFQKRIYQIHQTVLE